MKALVRVIPAKAHRSNLVRTARAPTNCTVVKESLGPVQTLESGPIVELKPSANSAFVRLHSVTTFPVVPGQERFRTRRNERRNSKPGNLFHITERGLRVKPSSISRDQPVRGFVPYKRCKIEQPTNICLQDRRLIDPKQ
jgi:hypothetical protein